ncbi:MAG: glycosyltransferase family 1 protein [Candidatus Electrothrix sp. AW3_4]|nr:glycosyltransferase family 1 protein [Candidatus Electrothrix gigas]
MQICMLVYYYWPVNAGGAENQCRILSSALITHGWECTVLTCRDDASHPAHEVDASGVRIYRKPSLESLFQIFFQAIGQRADRANNPMEEDGKIVKWQQRGLLLSRLKQALGSMVAKAVRYGNVMIFSLGVLFYFLRNYRTVDIVHVHTAEWIAGLAVLMGMLFKIPVLCKGATMPVFPPLQGIAFSPLFDSLRRRAHYIALTRDMHNNFLDNGVPPDRVTTISNGVILPELPTQAVQQSNEFLYVGNFSQSVKDKGFDILIEAWAKFHVKRPLARLTLVGGGDFQEWLHLARQLQCADSLNFAGYRTNLDAYYQRTCCFLLPSRNEGLSNALLESQSWGIPAIVSDIPGNREIILHEINGLIVPVENSEALAAACIHMLDNPLLREQYGNAARKRIEESFSMERIADLTVNLYKELLHGAKV